MLTKKLIEKHNKLSYRVIIPLTLLIVISITVFILNISRIVVKSESEVYDKMVDSFESVINMQVDYYIDRFDSIYFDYKGIYESQGDQSSKEKMIYSLVEKNSSLIDRIIVIDDVDEMGFYKIYDTGNDDLYFDVDYLNTYYDLYHKKEKFAFYNRELDKFYFANRVEDSLFLMESDLLNLYTLFDSDVYSEDATIGLITIDGWILADSDDRLVGKNVNELGFRDETLDEVFKLLSRDHRYAGDVGKRYSPDVGYNEYKYNFIPVSDEKYSLNWILMFEIPSDVFKSKVRDLSALIALGGLITVLILIVFSRLIINGALKPIDEIVDAMNSAAMGDLSVRTNIKSSNEIEVISLRLNEMLKHMEADRDDLVNQKNEILDLLNEVEELVQENNRVYYETIKSLAKTIDAKDAYTGGHCERVTEVSTKIGMELGLPEDDIRVLSYSGMLHDIGKIGVAESIISKDGRLTDAEFDEVKKHPQIGFDILKNINFLKKSSGVVLRHHERLDGTGYPNALKGHEIDLLSRIVSVADAFDAMSSDRAYRKALSKEECLSELRRASGSQFDEVVVETLISLLDNETIIAFDTSENTA